MYDRFKTLGAKRYMYEKDGEIYITVAGLSKKKGAEFLESKNDPFEEFTDDLTVPPSHSGRLVALHVDESTCGIMIDRDGVDAEWREETSAILYPTSYHLGLSENFAVYLQSITQYTE